MPEKQQEGCQQSLASDFHLSGVGTVKANLSSAWSQVLGCSTLVIKHRHTSHRVGREGGRGALQAQAFCSALSPLDQTREMLTFSETGLQLSTVILTYGSIFESPGGTQPVPMPRHWPGQLKNSFSGGEVWARVCF